MLYMLDMFYRFLIIIYKRKREYKTEYAWTVSTRYPLSSKLGEVQVIAATGELRICNHWRFVISAADHFGVGLLIVSKVEYLSAILIFLFDG